MPSTPTMPTPSTNTLTHARHLARASAIAAIMCSVASLTGCVVGSHKSVEVSGRQVDQNLLAQITPDKTTETQVIDMLGTPSRTMAADAGGTIFVWDYQRTENSAGHVLLIFGGSTQRVEQQSVSILIRDGLVRRVWQS